MVTGKITKLNPEKFEVRTKMATIGIRGCDLGFRVEEKKENIYVIALHEDEGVKIKGGMGILEGNKVGWGKDDQGKHLGWLKDKDAGWEKNVNEGGKAFAIDENGNVEENDISPEELSRLIEEVTPATGVDSGGSDTGSAEDNSAVEVGESSSDNKEGVQTEDSTGTLLADEGGGVPLSETDNTIINEGEIMGDSFMLADIIPPAKPLPPSEEILQMSSTEEQQPTQQETSPEEEPPPEEPTAEPVFVSQGTGIDYEWGTWELDGKYTGIEIFSPNNAIISASDFAAVSYTHLTLLTIYSV